MTVNDFIDEPELFALLGKKKNSHMAITQRSWISQPSAHLPFTLQP
ncbi:hypothetical protein AI3058V1_4470 [Citrobacter freundii]|nr:hypothetical protein AI3058V1_4470 [Citrobacter freundii]